MAKTDTELLINIDTGVITFRNDTNDTHCNCFPIRREHAAMVEKGELDVATLVAAIKQHVRDKQDFDFDAYIAERRKLNVRHTALHVDPPKPELADRSDELVSDAEIKAAKKDATTAKGAKGEDAVSDAVAGLTQSGAAPSAQKGKFSI
jgi:hypothetical protein